MVGWDGQDSGLFVTMLEMKGLTWTTLTTQQREKGSVRKMNTMEITIRRWAQIPWPSSQAAKKILN